MLRHFFAEPISYSWEWHSREVFASGGIAWVVAETTIREVGPDREVRAPYRISAVLEHLDGRWRWRLFHGSVPDEPSEDWSTIVRGN